MLVSHDRAFLSETAHEIIALDRRTGEARHGVAAGTPTSVSATPNVSGRAPSTTERSSDGPSWRPPSRRRAGAPRPASGAPGPTPTTMTSTSASG